ncbi:MAG: right-handed parallel beta-helix repeat-containing protein, partial [Planctomycetales bacterium]|nr:right-handed parallel beta-helix repeat-containing protein [Planctomycetales bacterium]
VVAAMLYSPPAPADDVAKRTTSSAAQARDNVRDFGAVGDGMHDDTAAIQKAVDSMTGAIRFPKGTYRLTQPVVIDLDRVGYTSLSGDGVAKIVMAGPGPAFRFVGTHFKSADPGGFEDNVWDRQRMPLVDGLAIHGEHEEACGIEAVGTMQLTVTRTHIRHVLHAIHLREQNRNVILSECHFYENHGVGVFYDHVNLHQSNITNCHISYCDGGGVVSRGGNVRNIHIAGCDIESNMSPDTPPTANVLIDCSESAYGTGEVAISGCTIQHNNPSPGSANIRIIGRSTPTERQPLVREGNVTIVGNVLSDVKVNVHLRDCRGVAISGNTFWQGYEHDLLIEDCSNIVIGANNLDRNPRYDYGNTADANNGVVLRGCDDCTLQGLHITNVRRKPAGLLVEECRRLNIDGCTILDCDNCGLLLRNVSHSRVSDCLVRDDRTESESLSIVVEGGEDNLLVDNQTHDPKPQ